MILTMRRDPTQNQRVAKKQKVGRSPDGYHEKRPNTPKEHPKSRKLGGVLILTMRRDPTQNQRAPKKRKVGRSPDGYHEKRPNPPKQTQLTNQEPVDRFLVG